MTLGFDNPLVDLVLGVLGWLCLVAYKREGCTKRIEQELKDFREEFRQHVKDNR